jgi:hypothetical protein
VYTLNAPRTLKKQPWTQRTIAQRPIATIAPSGDATRPAVARLNPPSGPQILGGGTVYRTPRGFRRADSLPALDSLSAPEPVSVARILDSIPFSPPDTSEFTFKPYRATLEPEYVTRPTIGYTRDTFGQGLSGSTAIVLGDMLGNHQLGFAASLNGRINETYFAAQYVNLSRRLNWTAGLGQEPYFFYEGAGISENPQNPSEALYTERIRRLVLRNVSAYGAYPFSRFRRFEIGASVVNVEDDIRLYTQPFDPFTGTSTRSPFIETISGPNITFVQPSAALVFDNSLYGPVGPMMGRRSRFEVSRTVGGWDFTALNFDYRRYDRLTGFFTFATKLNYFGRHGRDEDQFRFFAGRPEFLRGYTSGSFAKNECLNILDENSVTGCNVLDELVGTRMLLATAELRIPLWSMMRFMPAGFPLLEVAAFYDAALVWEGGIDVKLRRDQGDDPLLVRTPLTSVGASVRANILNFLILRADYSFPLQRPGVKGYWTLSLGPTF